MVLARFSPPMWWPSGTFLGSWGSLGALGCPAWGHQGLNSSASRLLGADLGATKGRFFNFLASQGRTWSPQGVDSSTLGTLWDRLVGPNGVELWTFDPSTLEPFNPMAPSIPSSPSIPSTSSKRAGGMRAAFKSAAPLRCMGVGNHRSQI